MTIKKNEILYQLNTQLLNKLPFLRANFITQDYVSIEENAELRRVLIQGIGYARICQELQAIELDNWQEYTLLKIDNDV